MNKIKLVAIDLAKRSYQIGALDEHGKILYNRKLSPAKFAEALQQLEPTIVAMEACSAAHYWGRRLIALGHEVRLVPRSEEHTSELQSRENLVCRLLLEKK